MASSINASTSGAGGLITTADNTGILNLQTASTTAVTIDTSQNVGIGTTSPSYKLQVYGASNPEMRLGDAVVTYQLYTEGATAAVMGTVGSHALVFRTNATERMRIDSSGNLLFNSGYGSAATAYGCRAWVNFNGTGTVAIRASGNVSSITDRGTGQYTLNFTTSMSDANYNVVAQATGWGAGRLTTVSGENSFTPTASAFQFNTWSYAEVYQDAPYVNLSVFR